MKIAVDLDIYELDAEEFPDGRSLLVWSSHADDCVVLVVPTATGDTRLRVSASDLIAAVAAASAGDDDCGPTCGRKETP